MGQVALLGRHRELALAREALDAVARGDGRLLLVEGEPGVGKTAWCDEVAHLARDRGLTVAWAACWESPAQGALGPWSLILEQLGVPPDVLAAAADEAEGGGLLHGRRERFTATVAAVRHAAHDRPAVIVLDDVHWADDATLALVEQLAHQIRAAPVGIVVATRTDVGPPGTPLRAVLDGLARQGQLVRLAGLGDDDTRRLLEDVTGTTVGPEAAAAWRRHADGNPLFLIELARVASSDGELPATPDTRGEQVPATVAAAFSARMAGSDAAQRELLAALAITGDEVPLETLTGLLDRSPTEVLELADPLVAQSLVHLTTRRGFTLAHPLLRSTVLHELGLARRVRWHERVAELLLEREAAGIESDPEALAHHLVEAAAAGRAGEAVARSVVAARHALLAGAFGRAASWLRIALDLLPLAAGAADEGALLLALAEAEQAAGNREAGRAALRHAAAVGRRRGDATALARAALAYAPGDGFEVALFDSEQEQLLAECLDGLDERQPALRAQVLARLSVARSLADDPEQRRLMSDEAVAAARASQDPHALAAALAAHCDACAGPADTALRRGMSSEIVDVGVQVRDPPIELLGRRLRLVAALEDGDLLAADREVEQYARVAARVGQPVFSWYVPLWRAMRALTLGNIAEQRRLVDEAERVGQAADSENAVMLVMTQRLIGAVEVGHPDEVASVIDGLGGPATLNMLDAHVASASGYALAAAGRLDDARALYDRNADLVLAVPLDSEWAAMLVQVSNAVALMGGHPLAEPVYERLAPHAAHHAIEGIGAFSHGAVARSLGNLAAPLGDIDAARRHFDDALRWNRGAGLPLMVARTHRDAGVALHDRAHLEEARTRYERLDIPGRVAELDDLLGVLAARSGRPVTAARRGTWSRDGDGWLVAWSDQSARLRDRKGMSDLAVLLAHPGTEVPALDLYGAPGASAVVRPDGDLGEVLDETARRAYRARLVDLEAELDEADARGDLARSSRAAAERDALVEQLTGAYGLGGRARRAGAVSERARTAVTARVREALKAVEAALPPLGRHLRAAVRTGAFCSYDPDEPVDWEL